MHKWIAKVHDSPSPGDAAEDLLRQAVKRPKSLTDNNELTLYRRSDEPVAFVAPEIKAPDCVGGRADSFIKFVYYLITKVWTAISLSSYVGKSVLEYCVVFVLRKTRRKTLSGFLPTVCLRRDGRGRQGCFSTGIVQSLVVVNLRLDGTGCIEKTHGFTPMYLERCFRFQKGQIVSLTRFLCRRLSQRSVLEGNRSRN